MSTIIVGGAVTGSLDAPAKPSSIFKHALLHTVQGRVGIASLTLIFLVILLGPLFAPYSYSELGVGAPLERASLAHLFGTDQLGRDILSRLLFGGGTVVLVPLVAVTLAFCIGGGVGTYGAYKGGKTDLLITRTFDLFLAVPPLLLALVIISALGTSPMVLVAVVTIVYIPRIGRVIRGATQGIITNDYVAAAEARGESTLAILLREVFPNVMGLASAEYALRLTYSILFVATLSFLGLGAQPPSSDWGLMVAESRGFISINPWATLAPSLAIAILSVGFNLVADALASVVGASENGRVVI
ncbi:MULTISPECIES: ABC transporter permease [unclassified Mesorhizobium]|uniref:ABC transporter permease n=1 Tax=unclassified Mesorhizobium TaxID=325217 RepID=UPI001092732C|nr:MULTISPECIES: ABC transporter permease [unclassified Mesorhizobium]TGU40076.1 ABC transporter permease [bacterium M00.F.Ca.ET.156.01.1.1]TGV15133.1 ABC transporter permease [Mesorhizobium sp. M8A.F.Ca.ET.173.01.1.1]TGQ77270.1 ABC transporter permease [Mesorhizobium sp. M8A.F.Ca.ET.207.01.1.1]TGQ89093.1 ABC transporter permease [Mesorhizobium sp. M8A.F.Ca.ET.208.01.1.1]TGR32198.1 ABC transporter permease [Mesorhizobium sp. M8A.F.Ca.ET.202.01.1.1]